MKIIRIYNKSYTRLLTLTEPDFNALNYRHARGEIGDCSFVVKLGRGKMNEVNLNLYNRITLFEDGTPKFTGIITQKQISLDTALIKCRELPYILKKRIVGTDYSISGDINDAVEQLIDDINAVESTGITVGSLAGVGTVNLTFNKADAWTVLKQICEATGNQFKINEQRKLIVAPTIGDDKSSSVVFRYNVDHVANANLLSFEIEDDGEHIVTVAHGKSDTLTSDQENPSLVSIFGTLEKYRNFRVVNTQEVLDEFTASEVADRIYSPKLVLKPNVPDNFNVGDIVQVRLKNPLVNLNDTFQVLEKRLKYNGNQKLIEVWINDLPNYLVQKLADRDKRLELLEKQVI